MRYLSGEEVLYLHSEIIDETGGMHGVRDAGLFASIIEKPKMKFGGKDLHHGVFGKAAAYFHGFSMYHVFVDGNKRTAVAASARFLARNGYELTATNQGVEAFALHVVSNKLDLPAIAAWIKAHSRRHNKNQGR